MTLIPGRQLLMMAADKLADEDSVVMGSTLQTVTAEELFMMGGDAYFELVKGELRPVSPAGSMHGRVITRLSLPMGSFVKENRLGEIFGAETGFILVRNPDTVRAPDIAFVNAERIDSVGNIDEYWPGAPDLAVEVVSPSDRIYELEEKVEDFLNAGARAVWVVNPKRHTVTIHCSAAAPLILTESDILDGGDVLPGFSIPVADIFPPK